MAETKFTPFEELVRAAMHSGGMRPQAARQLRDQLAAAARRHAPPRRASRRLWAGAVAILLLVITLVMGPQRVLAQVLSWFGYVPGVGFVQLVNGLRILAEPLIQERDGIRLTVESGLIDDEHTVISLLFEGIRQEQKPASEDVVGCWQNPVLSLPDLSRLQSIGGESVGGPSWMRLELTYPALYTDVNEAVLEVPCVPEVLPGLGPENWEIPLHFVSAPHGFQVLPVHTLAPATQAASAHGFELSVDEYVELEDGYLLRGRLSWAESEFTHPDFWWLELSLLDADGRNIPVEFDPYTDPQSEQTYVTWTLRTNTKYISSPARIVIEDLSMRVLMDFAENNSFEIDFGSAPQSGQTWQLDKALHLGDHTVQMGQASFRAQADGTYMLTSHITFDPEYITTLNLMDRDNQSQMLAWGGGDNLAVGQMEIGIIYDYLPTGVHRLWVDNYFVRLAGPWQASITLPPPSGEPPQANVCLTPENSRQARRELPSGLQGHFLVQDFSTGGMLPSLYLANLDGNQRQFIDIGSWPTLSPDGRQVAYARDGLRIFDTETGQTRRLIQEDSSYAMSWSPDGTRLAFVRGGQGVYLINADGSDLRPIAGSRSDMIGIAGWLPDGEHILVSRIVPEGSLLQVVNVQTGTARDGLLMDNRKGGFVQLAADGKRVTYGDQIFGGFSYSLFLGALDGSPPRLLAESGAEVMFSSGAWLGEEWLAVNLYEPATTSYKEPLLLNLASCESYALPLQGVQIMAWGP